MATETKPAMTREERMATQPIGRLMAGMTLPAILAQIINIALQIGMWATPTLWDISRLEGGWVTVLKLNPLVYIVNGYRSAVCERQWFYQDFFSTMYFWIVTVVLFGIGAAVFKRLKVHFADVL